MGWSLAIVVGALMALVACGDVRASGGSPLGTGQDSPIVPVGTTPNAESMQGAPEMLPPAVDELQRLRSRIAELEQQLADERARTVQREREWVEFLRALSHVPIEQVPERPGFLADAVIERVPVDGVLPRPESEAEIGADRRRQLMRALNALLVSEQVLSMDVLEVGLIQAGWCGPVVVRLLDERGRPVGSLVSERLRLEVSRAGFGVTLVFEEGYERHAGVKIPFGPVGADGLQRTGVRRIHLPDLNPEPWVELVPELISEQDLLKSQDDGLWQLRPLRQRLDGLLRAAGTPLGGWRLVELGGVVDNTLNDVQLIERDGDGREVRRLFADRLRIEAEPGGGLRLDLQGGIQVRNGRRAPFLAGRYRIFLPRAKASVWRAENLPGLSEPKEISPPATGKG